MSKSVIYVQIFAILSCVYVCTASIEVIKGPESATGFILRNKRDPSRAMTFSGFMPGGSMSAFASSADFNPYFRSNRPSYHSKWSPSAPAPAPEDGKNFRPVEGESLNSNLQPPQENAGDEKHWNTEQEQESPAPEVPASEDASVAVPDDAKKPKKKYNHRTSPRDEREQDEDEYERPGQGGNAAASFNAWFPIMLGMFPPSVYQQPGQSADGGATGYGSNQGRNPASSFTTVVANSVSHGRNGVASSHAVAYGGGSPQQQQRPQNTQG